MALTYCLLELILEITQEYVKEALEYDPETGIFKWRLDRPDHHFKDWRGRNGFIRNISPDRVAGNLQQPTERNPCSYIVIGLSEKLYRAHRLAWLYVYGDWPSEDVDHINLDTTDNRIENLRLSLDKLNHRNRSRYKNNTSGISGVSFHAKLNKWQAEGQQVIDGKRVRHYLGVFASFFDACAARKSWELRFGYSENHGKDIGRLINEQTYRPG